MSEAHALRDLLAESEEITIVCHNNPDPDCLASALALGRIAAAAGIDERQIVYSGTISHQQNRAFVNLFEVDLKPFDADAVRTRPDGSLVAFVDHSVPSVNNDVPEGTPIDVVIDHHPAEGIEAAFVDYREGVGATATILTEHVRALDVELDSTLSTGLLFAIRRETLGFLRGATRAEYDAAGYLHDGADIGLLRQLSSPSITGATIDAIADAIENRCVRGSMLITHVGRTGERDALPQAADYLRSTGSKRRWCSGSRRRLFSWAPGRPTRGSTWGTRSSRRSPTSGARAATARWPAARYRSASSPTPPATIGSSRSSRVWSRSGSSRGSTSPGVPIRTRPNLPGSEGRTRRLARSREPSAAFWGAGSPPRGTSPRSGSPAGWSSPARASPSPSG